MYITKIPLQNLQCPYCHFSWNTLQLHSFFLLVLRLARSLFFFALLLLPLPAVCNLSPPSSLWTESVVFQPRACFSALQGRRNCVVYGTINIFCALFYIALDLYVCWFGLIGVVNFHTYHYNFHINVSSSNACLTVICCTGGGWYKYNNFGFPVHQ